MSKYLSRLGSTALALVAGSIALYGQTSATSGAITVKLTDTQGASVAGARVTIASSQITKFDQTGNDGMIRFGLLSPGAYKVTVTKSGYQTVSQTITVKVNEVSFVNFTKIAQDSGTIVEVVAAAAPSVDVTSATTGTTTTSDVLGRLPIGTNIFNAAGMAPSVVQNTNSGGMSISGASGVENSYVLDGLGTGNVRNGGAGTQLAPEFVDTLEIQTGGFKPEFSAMGGVINVVSKAGTNKMEGSFGINGNLPGIDARPFFGFRDSQGNQTARGRQYRDSAKRESVFTLGGPIIKDKLFFFVGATGYTQTLNGDAIANFNIDNVVASNQPIKNEFLNSYAKLNYYLTPTMQATLAIQRVNDVKENPVQYTTTGTANVGMGYKSSTTTISLNYDWTISPSLFLTMKVGNSKDKFKNVPGSNDLEVLDRARLFYYNGTPATDYRTGGAGFVDNKNDAETTQYRADLSWFVGDHNIKGGFSYSENSFEEISGYSGNPGLFTPYLGSVTNPVATAYSNAPIVRIRRNFNTPGVGNTGDTMLLRWYGQNAKVKSKFTAFYLQDTWEILSGLRATYGARLEGQEHLDAKGKTFFDFKNLGKHVQPRLSVVWDVNGDQATKVSLNVAKYFEQIPLQPTMRQGGREYFLDNYYGSSTGKFIYNRTTGAYSLAPNVRPDYVKDFAIGFAAPPQVDGLRLPSRMEYQAGVTHTFRENDPIVGKFLKGWVGEINYRFRQQIDVMEDTVITDRDGNYTNLRAGAGAADFGYAIMWNPTPGHVSWTDANGVKVHADWTPYPEASNISRTWEFKLNKSTEKYTINLSYTRSYVSGNYEGMASESNGQLDANITAGWDYYPYVGNGILPIERRHSYKVQGVYNFDVFGDRLSLGMQAFLTSGAARTFWYDGSADGIPDVGGYGDATPYKGKFGANGRQPWSRGIDASLEYEHKLTKKIRLTPKFEITNLLNNRYITGYNDYMTDQTGNPDAFFNAPTGYRVGRKYRFAFSVKF